MKNIGFYCLLGLSFTLNACTSVTVIPKSKNTQTIITNASTEREAIKIVTHKAKRICIVQNKLVKMIELDTVYQGNNSKQKELIKLAKTILPKDKTTGSYTQKDYIHKAKLTFKCI